MEGILTNGTKMSYELSIIRWPFHIHLCTMLSEETVWISIHYLVFSIGNENILIPILLDIAWPYSLLQIKVIYLMFILAMYFRTQQKVVPLSWMKFQSCPTFLKLLHLGLHTSMLSCLRVRNFITGSRKIFLFSLEGKCFKI